MEKEYLKKLFSKTWSQETCSPGLKKNWNKENASLGQCAITALIINDLYGGKIMRCMASTGSHYYNLINNEIVDLTVEQFQGEIPDYSKGEERTREYLLSNEDTLNRYKILLERFSKTTKLYKLLDENGIEHLSLEPGALGGNRKLKIYGKLDCPSANRWIKEGHYIKNRVFFKDEKTAIEAGYRPCAICMKDKYLKWKEKQSKTIRYTNYENINVEEELAKIEQCEYAEIHLEPTNKACLFILGLLFANGIKIKILNEDELDLTQTGKSFSMMPYVWSRLSDDSFPSKGYKNIKTEMDDRVENIKRLGVQVSKIEAAPEENKIFLICPVRNATANQRKWIEDFVKEKIANGFVIHAPHLHTRQKDIFGGYAICMQNATAVSTSSEIDIYYDQSSAGSVFDLGVAYALHKPLKILNKEQIELNENDFIDKIVDSWPYSIESPLKTKKIHINK